MSSSVFCAHRNTSLSSQHVTRYFPSGDQLTHGTGSSCPRNRHASSAMGGKVDGSLLAAAAPTSLSSGMRMRHSATVPSFEAVASIRPSCRKERYHTSSSCSSRSCLVLLGTSSIPVVGSSNRLRPTPARADTKTRARFRAATAISSSSSSRPSASMTPGGASRLKASRSLRLAVA